MSDDWFNDPDDLRCRALEYDEIALSDYRSGNVATAETWEGKARALRSRARVIERGIRKER